MAAEERNDAQSLAKIRELASRLASRNGDVPVRPTSEPKSSKPGKPRAGGNGSKQELNLGELVRLQKDGSEYIFNTEGRIARAQTVEELMELADRISSKKGSQKEKFSLKLANGLPGLLPLDEDFSKKFNGLIDRWEKRIVEVFFDDAHTKHFRSSLRDVLKITPDVDKGMFFSRYLDYFDCSALGDVVPVRKKLVALWKEQLPAVRRELKDQKKQERKSDTSSLAGKLGDQPPLPDSQLTKPRQSTNGTKLRNKPSTLPIDMDDAVRDARDRSENGKHPDQPEMMAWARRHDASGTADVPVPPDGRPELNDLLQSEARWEEKVGVIKETLRGITEKMSVLQNLSEETKMEALKRWMIEQVEKCFQGVSLEQRGIVAELLLEKNKIKDL